MALKRAYIQSSDESDLSDTDTSKMWMKKPRTEEVGIYTVESSVSSDGEIQAGKLYNIEASDSSDGEKQTKNNEALTNSSESTDDECYKYDDVFFNLRH